MLPEKFRGSIIIVVALSVRPSVLPSVRPIRVRPITSLFEVGFRNNFTEMTTMLRQRVARNIWVYYAAYILCEHLCPR